MASSTDTKVKIPFEFYCGPGATSVFYHDLPSTLVRAAGMGMTLAYRQYYFQTVGPIAQQYEQHCVAASQKQCAVCDIRPTKTVLMTPMSYLHLKDAPKVHVMVTPICEMPQCSMQGKMMVNDMVKEVIGGAEGAKVPGLDAEQKPTARNAHCPCGSSRKYKKCCGSNSAMDDVD